MKIPIDQTLHIISHKGRKSMNIYQIYGEGFSKAEREKENNNSGTRKHHKIKRQSTETKDFLLNICIYLQNI